MIKEFKKSIGYICPGCSAIETTDINLFDFSGEDAVPFSCADCGESALLITPKKDKYTISVSCPMCEEQHTFNIRKVTFWQSSFFSLSCPETGIGIFFIGSDDIVKDELSRQEEMFVQMNEDFAISEELTMIFDTVERINEIAKSGKVSCTCGSNAISIEIDNEKITLRCRDCGRTKNIPATSESLDNLLNASAIVLD